MKRHIKYLTTILILTVFMMFSLCGCGEQEVIPVTEPTIEITADGELIAYLVESFDKDYYDLGELDNMVREEVADFVKNHALVAGDGKQGMSVESVAMSADGSANVVVALRFTSPEVYEMYFETELFYGTVEEAEAAGYGLSAALVSVKDGELFSAEQSKKYAKRKVLVLEDPVVVRCPKGALFVGIDTSLTAEGFVDCTQGEGLDLIIMK